MIVCLITALALSFSLNLEAAERSIDTVDLADLPDAQEVRVDFNRPLQYLSHSPLNSSRIVQVRFRPVDREIESSREVEEFNWQATDNSPLQEMVLEKDEVSELKLTLRFSRKVDFEVKSGDDLRRFAVRVFKPVAEYSEKVATTAAAPIMPGAGAVGGVAGVNLDYPYTITLKTSEKPFGKISIAATPELEKYRVYATELEKKGKTVYRIRVGFFPDQESAEAIVGSIRKVFATAWISKVSKRERLQSHNGIIELQYPKSAAGSGEVETTGKQGLPETSGASFFGGIDLRHPYAINLESADEYRRFALTIESDPADSKVADKTEEILGPRWTVKLRRKVHYDTVGTGSERRVVVRVRPGDEEDLQRSLTEQQMVDEIVRKLQLKPGVFQNYRLYTSKIKTDDGKVWNRLRLGFFPSREEAEEVLGMLKKNFPDAWVAKVSEEERAGSERRSIGTASMRITPFLTAMEQMDQKEDPLQAPKLMPPLSQQRVLTLMDEAEKEMTAGNYRRSIQIYTRILQDQDQQERKKAQELLGLARERNGQLAHAKAEYEKFIQMYPEGEDTERVKQRLVGLLTARATPPKVEMKKQSSRDRMEVFGSLSQYYYYDELNPETGVKTVTRSSLSSDLVFNVRKRAANIESRTLFVGGYEADGTSGDNITRINTFYIDADNKRTVSGRFGRQSRSTGGVLGRFDGGLLTYKFASKMKANLVGGFPVASDSLDQFATDKYFYGLSFDIGPYANYWNLSTFIINQEDNGFTERQAAGGEIRFFHPRASFFALADYDLYFDELNTALINGNINLPNKIIINLAADYRNSPILLPNNALSAFLGRNLLPDPADLTRTVTVTTLDDLRLYLTEDEIREIARAATYKTSSYMLGLVKPVSKKLQVGLDATATKIYASDDFSTSMAELVPGDNSTTPVTPPSALTINTATIQEEKPFEYAYTLQFIGSSLVKEGDIAILSGTYHDRNEQEVYTVNVNTRYPISRYWRLNPRISASYIKIRGLESSQFRTRPLLRMDYRLRKPRIHFTIEAGGEWNDFDPDGSTNTTNYFGSLGYRYDF